VNVRHVARFQEIRLDKCKNPKYLSATWTLMFKTSKSQNKTNAKVLFALHDVEHRPILAACFVTLRDKYHTQGKQKK